MIIPIRCYTCGKPVAAFWDEYEKKVNAGEAPAKVLDELGIDRYCCRRMFLSHRNLIDELVRFGPKGTTIK